ncbi:hypothetical protein ELY33_02305 [Vreelandella andesensis]|uniref:Uncharacterized protein n=1 Tax=Vreelandella andesensis TaxID=447567 RepID=A0A433KWR5_9GAMM|nr:hypothetical protein [Halomonas andesensis]RUR34072.1 hypothetical protein ELY33_02305 [Halomonas andesensis]
MTTSPHTWIDHNNPAQLKWIANYLSRTQPDFSLAFMGDDFAHPERADHLITEIKNHMDSPAFREQYGKLRNAWRQKKVRQQRDKKSATFVLPVATLTTLEKLAKKHNHSKVKELSTVISDAWHDHLRATEIAHKANSTYRQELKNQRASYEQREQAYQRVVEKLLAAVAEQIDKRCALEAKIGGADSSPLESGDIATYEALIEPHKAAIEPHLTNLTLVRFKGESLSKQLANLVQARKKAAEAPKIPGEP